MLFKVSGLKRAGYYKWVKRPARRDDKEELILQEFNANDGKQGIHMLKRTLWNKYGVNLNHKRIRGVLRKSGLKSVIRQQKQRKQAENLTIKENVLNREFNPTEPNKVLATDFTYIAVQGNTYFLSVVLDLYDNNPLVWYISDRSDRSLSLNTIELLRKKIDIRGCLIHSDQGIQYSCTTYCEYLEREGVIQSMSRRGNCWDNAVIENFFGIIKTESIYLYPARARNLESLIELLEEEFDYYANRRPQKLLGGMPPNNYRKQYYDNLKN